MKRNSEDFLNILFNINYVIFYNYKSYDVEFKRKKFIYK